MTHDERGGVIRPSPSNDTPPSSFLLDEASPMAMELLWATITAACGMDAKLLVAVYRDGKLILTFDKSIDQSMIMSILTDAMTPETS